MIERIFFPLTFLSKYLIVVSTSGNSGMKNKLNPNQYNITDIFENVSRAKYDFMNDIMSFGIHRLWKKYYVDLLHDKFNKKEKILDIASGSGDIFQLFPHNANLYAIDPIDQMHEISTEKNSEKKILYTNLYMANIVELYSFLIKSPIKKIYYYSM